MAIDIEMWSRLLRRMSYRYSIAKDYKEELKDFAVISACRKRLINIPDNDNVLKMFYDSVTNTYDIEGISVYLMDRGDILIDKELTVKNINGKDIIMSVEDYVTDENNKREKQLRNAILSMSYAVSSIDSSYIKNYSNQYKSNERLLFVVNIDNRTDFVASIAKMSEYYNQDCFMIKPAYDDEAYLIGTNEYNDVGLYGIRNTGILKIDENSKEYGKYMSLTNDEICYKNSRNIAKNGRRDSEGMYSSRDELETIRDHFYPMYIAGLISTEAIPATNAVHANRKWDWLDELNNNVKLSDDIEFLNKKFIFKDHDDYSMKVNTLNTIQNGVTMEFLREYYNGDILLWVEDNKTNTGCFNCWNCVECKDCNNCTECYRCKTCSNCQNCDRCKKSIDCNKCTKCEKCERCKNLENLYMYHDNAKYIY